VESAPLVDDGEGDVALAALGVAAGRRDVGLPGRPVRGTTGRAGAGRRNRGKRRRGEKRHD
jgi:hypothetical protein